MNLKARGWATGDTLTWPRCQADIATRLTSRVKAERPWSSLYCRYTELMGQHKGAEPRSAPQDTNTRHFRAYRNRVERALTLWTFSMTERGRHWSSRRLHSGARLLASKPRGVDARLSLSPDSGGLCAWAASRTGRPASKPGQRTSPALANRGRPRSSCATQT